jgi:hypothetical protein
MDEYMVISPESQGTLLHTVQAEQRGQIGLTLLAYWYESETEKPEDREAAARANDFSIGW